MATIDDAINAYCAWLKRNVSPLHNSAYVLSLETTIRILQQKPRDATVERLLEQKKAAKKQARRIEDGERLRVEIDARE